MSARVDKIAPSRRAKTEEIIVGFDSERMKAPFLLRCGALMIDYILIISVPVGSLLLGRLIGNDGARLLNSEISNVGWLIMILLALTNFLIFPMFSGQSLGKMLTGLRITSADGSAPSFTSIILRHFVGYPITLLTGGLGFLLSAFTAGGRALHDYLGGTTVVFAERKISKVNLAMKEKARGK